MLCLVCFAVSITLPQKCGHAQARVDATILAVVDGDTLRVRLANDRELLRLIGLDTPEARINKRAEKQAERNLTDTQTILNLGERAKSAVTAMAPIGTRITIEFDTERRDHYGRLLGYVYLPDGEMLNQKVLSMGYAKLLTVPPNVRHLNRLQSAYAEGRQARRGLWSMDGFSDAPKRPSAPLLPPIFRVR
jgi:micrococcal nuclease